MALVNGRPEGQPSVTRDSGPPRAVYLAPVYEWRGRQRFIIGERLTSMEMPLSADPRDEARYLRKGYKIASKADIARLAQLDGRMRMFDEPLDDVEKLGIVQKKTQRELELENKVKEMEQRLAIQEAAEAAKDAAKQEIRQRAADGFAKARAAKAAKAEAAKAAKAAEAAEKPAEQPQEAVA